MNGRPIRAALCAITAALLVASCGSGTSDSQQVRSLVNRFTIELGLSNPAACNLMTPRFQDNLVQLSLTGAADCAAAVQNTHEWLFLSSLKISKVDISGSKATVVFDPHLQVGGGPEVASLSKQHDKWLVNDVGR